MPNRQDPRVPWFACILLTALCMVLALENAAVRSDQSKLKEAYAGFLSTKAKGSTLESKIKPGSLAVYKAEQGVVACAMMK